VIEKVTLNEMSMVKWLEIVLSIKQLLVLSMERELLRCNQETDFFEKVNFDFNF